MNIEFIAKKLIDLRGGRTQEEVAKALSISKSALSMYENGQRVPRDEIKIRISRYYRQSIESIFFNQINDTKCGENNPDGPKAV